MEKLELASMETGQSLQSGQEMKISKLGIELKIIFNTSENRVFRPEVIPNKLHGDICNLTSDGSFTHFS